MASNPFADVHAALVEVMTDKATVTIGAPKSGKIAGLRAQVGAAVRVGDILVVIQTGNGSLCLVTNALAKSKRWEI